MLRSAFLLLASSTFLAGCAAERDDVPPEDLSVIRPQLDSLWARLGQAMTTADTATMRMIYTDSSTCAETGWPTAGGRAAIVSGASGVFACCRYMESRFQPEVTEVSRNRATQFGTYRDVIEPTGQPRLAMFGRVSATLERDTTGAWRVSRLVVIRDSSVTLKAASAGRPPSGP